jgi:FtsP/CotA-like multicopper oxidase with cupredoxin domain
MAWHLSRRSWLNLAGLGSLATGLLAGSRAAGQSSATPMVPQSHHNHAMGTVGHVTPELFDALKYLKSWNFSDLPPVERARVYRETPRPDGTLLREYELIAVDREIEIAPGIFFPAWTYNGQVPGPTIRATEGDRVKVTFTNQGTHPHTIHFHGWH